MPDFDPLDGGVDARVLFVFEKPGPMTSTERSGRRKGSGFISRDNDDSTAEATYRFMQAAGLDRKSTLLWNIVPAWNGTRKITKEELGNGLRSLQALMDLLPLLRGVVGVGRRAEKARALVVSQNLPWLNSPHPSPLVRARYPDRWTNIPQQWTKAREWLANGE